MLKEEVIVLERLKMLSDEINMSQSDIARTLNVSRECYCLYETGRRHIPAEVLCNLSRIHNVSTDYILNITDDRSPFPTLSEDEIKLLEHYKQLDKRGKRVALNVLSNELNELKQSHSSDDPPDDETDE
jgi:transcriptional regulator with XRE-family HTH domain